MTGPRHRGGRGRRAVAVTVGAALAVAISLAGVRMWSDAAATGQVMPTESGASSPSAPLGEQHGPPPQIALPARRAASVLVPEPPTSARLPSGAIVPIRAVSTTPDGRLDVPADIRAAGWWRGGSRIGDPFGSTLLAAHVDSAMQGLGPYAELLGVHRGQQVRLKSTHLEQIFTIRSLSLVHREALVKQHEIFAPDGERRLTLVTCAPPYIRDRGGYQNLAVVTAVPVSDPKADDG